MLHMEERHNKKIAQKIFSTFFLIAIFASLVLFYSILFRPQKDISDDEKRTLQKIPVLSFQSFFDKTYQTQMEDAVGDQLLYSGQIRYGTKQFYYFFTEKCANIDELSLNGTKIDKSIFSTNHKIQFANTKTKQIKPPKELESANAKENAKKISAESKNPTESTSVKEREITTAEEISSDEIADSKELFPTEKLASAPDIKEETEDFLEQKTYDYVYKEVMHDALYTLDDSGWIVVKGVAPEKYTFRRYPPEMLDKVHYPKYLFFIETSESTDFREPQKYNAFEYVKTQMPNLTGYDALTFKNFDEYKNYFYQTDHHWNYIGAYKSYVKIMKMMEGNDFQVRIPVGEKHFDFLFNGSFSWQAGVKFSTEKFTVYEFYIPPYKTYINDEEKQYHHRELYDTPETTPHSNFANHYGWYYGLDFAKVVYDFDQPEKESILILGTSYTNAINELVASHYNKTHILDFRLYYDQYGEKIDAAKYMEENGLTKLLIIGDISSVGKRTKTN